MTKIEMDTTNEIYYGDRGAEFRGMLYGIFASRTNMGKEKIDALISKNEKIFAQAFTASSANPEENYENLEQLGDLSVNKFIVGYMYKRFPKLYCPAGVKVVARLRIKYASKDVLYLIAQSLGFWKFISASVDQRSRGMKSLLEDCMESFVGATEMAISSMTIDGFGYVVVQEILSSIFDEMPISLKYEELYDAKTRLKEICDFFKQRVTGLKYVEEYPECEEGHRIVNCRAMVKFNGAAYSGEGSASLKADAQQRAAERLIEILRRFGVEKEIPDIYDR